MCKKKIYRITSKLVELLPCTASKVVEWRLRNWRTQEQRQEFVILAGVALVGISFLVLSIESLPNLETRWSLPDSTCPWIAMMIFFFGVGTGYRAYSMISSWLGGHWLGWCLSGKQRKFEILAQGLWKVDVSIGKILLSLIALLQLVDFHVNDILVVAEVFFVGYALSFCISHAAGVSIVFFRKHRWMKIIPGIALIQISNPYFLSLLLIFELIMVSIMSFLSIQTGHRGMLVMVALIAVVGFVFIHSFMSPGAAVLRSFLGWTGLSIWRGLWRLMIIPICIALLLSCPIIISVLILQEWTWVGMGVAGIVIAGYTTLIWIVQDLVNVGQRRGGAFMLLHLAIPSLSLFLIGPVCVLVICAHLGWLIWRANFLWKS